MAADRTDRARGVVQRHLLPGEHIRAACVTGLRDELTGLGLLTRAERAFGLILGSFGVAVLTSERLVWLPVRARDRSGNRWYRAQFAAPGLLAVELTGHGGLCELTVRTGLGERRLLARRKDAAQFQRLAEGLGLRV